MSADSTSKHWQQLQLLLDGEPLQLSCVKARTAWARRKGVGALGRLEAGEALLLCREPLIHMLGIEQALDLVFLSPRGRVAKVYANVQPGLRLRTCARGWNCLELAAGGAAQLALARGSRLSFLTV